MELMQNPRSFWQKRPAASVGSDRKVATPTRITACPSRGRLSPMPRSIVTQWLHLAFRDWMVDCASRGDPASPDGSRVKPIHFHQQTTPPLAFNSDNAVYFFATLPPSASEATSCFLRVGRNALDQSWIRFSAERSSRMDRAFLGPGADPFCGVFLHARNAVCDATRSTIRRY